MKKALILLIALTLTLSMFACNKNDATESDANESDASSSSEAEENVDCAKAQELIDQGKYEEAYKLLYNSDEEKAKEMLGDFRVCYTTEKHYSTVNNAVHTTLYEYDNRGNLLKKDQCQDYAPIYEYTYDSNDNILTERTSYASGDYKLFTYTYDENNRCIKEVEEEVDGGRRKPDKVVEKTYDDYGNVIEKKITGTYDNTYNYEYIYDENGNILKKTSVDLSGKENIYEYTYDANGNILTESHEDGSYSKEYTYDDKGNLIKQVNKNYNGLDLEVLEYIFNDENQLVKEIHTRSGSAIETYEYQYNDKGLKIYQKYSNTATPEPDDHTEYFYDDVGNLIKMRGQYEGSENYSYVEYSDFHYYYCPKNN